MTSLFQDVVGSSPLMRIYDYLLTNREIDVSLTDIARDAKVGRATLYRMLNNLLRKRILVKTRVLGRSQLFKLNSDRPDIKRLAQLHDEVLLNDLRKRASRKARP